MLAVDDLQWCDTGSLRCARLPAAPARGPAGAGRRPPCAPASRTTTRRCSPSSPEDPRPSSRAPRAAGAGGDRRAGPATGSAPTPHELFIAACHRTTSGNPLLLRQLLRALEADGRARPTPSHADTVQRHRLARRVEHGADAAAPGCPPTHRGGPRGRRAGRRRRAAGRRRAGRARRGRDRGRARGAGPGRGRPRRPPARRSSTRWSGDAVYRDLPAGERELAPRARRRAAARPRGRRPSRSPPTCSSRPARGDAGGGAGACARRPQHRRRPRRRRRAPRPTSQRALAEPPRAERAAAACCSSWAGSRP